MTFRCRPDPDGKKKQKLKQLSNKIKWLILSIGNSLFFIENTSYIRHPVRSLRLLRCSPELASLSHVGRKSLFQGLPVRDVSDSIPHKFIERRAVRRSRGASSMNEHHEFRPAQRPDKRSDRPEGRFEARTDGKPERPRRSLRETVCDIDRDILRMLMRRHNHHWARVQ